MRALALMWLLAGWGLVASSLAGPRIAVVGSEFNFGEENHLKPINHIWLLSNEGDAPLEILQLEPKCGCTVVDLTTRTLQPGETVRLRAQLDMSKFRGRIRKSIVVHSNDPQQPALTLSFVGTAVVRVEVMPPVAFFAPGAAGERVRREVLIRAQDPRPLVLELEAWDADVLAAPRLVMLEEHRVYRLELESLPMEPGAQWASEVVLKTNYTDHPQARVQVNGYLAAQWFRANKEALVLRSGQRRPSTQLVVLAPLLAEDLEVTRVELPHDSLEAEITKRGKNVLVTVRNLRALPELDGKIIRLHTNVPQAPIFELPIFIE